MKISDLDHLIANLLSPVWSERTDALKKLLALNEVEDIQHAFERILLTKESSHVFSFIQLLENLLNSGDQNEAQRSLALSILFKLNIMDNIKISSESEKIIDTFFDSPRVYRYIKVSTLRNAWKLSDEEQYIQLTKEVGSRNFFELVPLVLRNFSKVEDDELIKTSIEVIKRLEDTRAIRFLKEISKETKDGETLCLALRTLGEIGGFFDGFFFKPYLYNDSKAVKFEAIRGIGKTLNDFSLSSLMVLYQKSKDVEIKEEIILVLGKIHHSKAAKNLVNIYENEQESRLLLKVEWAMQSIGKDLIVPMLIKKFRSSAENEKLKFKILTFFGQIYHEKCFELLNDIIIKK